MSTSSAQGRKQKSHNKDVLFQASWQLSVPHKTLKCILSLPHTYSIHTFIKQSSHMTLLFFFCQCWITFSLTLMERTKRAGATVWLNSNAQNKAASISCLQVPYRSCVVWKCQLTSHVDGHCLLSCLWSVSFLRLLPQEAKPHLAEKLV